MKDRIVLRNVATVLTDDEVKLVSGGDEIVPPDDGDDGGGPGYGYGGGYGGGGGTSLTGGQTTQKVSSEDPNGPLDEDKSVADF